MVQGKLDGLGVESIPAPALATPKQKAYIVTLCGKLDIDPEAERDLLKDESMTEPEAHWLIRRLIKQADQRKAVE